jgi:hypothetical protein
VTIEEYMRLAHAALDETHDALRRGIATLSEHGEPTEEELQPLQLGTSRCWRLTNNQPIQECSF